MVPCSFPVTFMYGEWVLGVMVKAQLISRTASDFRRRVVVTKRKMEENDFLVKIQNRVWWKQVKST